MNLPQEWGNGTSQPVHMNIYQSKSCSKRSKLPTFRWWAKGFKRRIKWRTNTHNLARCHRSWWNRLFKIFKDKIRFLSDFNPLQPGAAFLLPDKSSCKVTIICGKRRYLLLFLNETQCKDTVILYWHFFSFQVLLSYETKYHSSHID